MIALTLPGGSSVGDAKEAHDFTVMCTNGRKLGIAFSARIRYNILRAALDARLPKRSYFQACITVQLLNIPEQEQFLSRLSYFTGCLHKWAQSGLARIESRQHLLLLHREDHPGSAFWLTSGSVIPQTVSYRRRVCSPRNRRHVVSERRAAKSVRG